ncbi:glutathione S-transferase family protein [Falsigemmobacter faecalis]|uniref:Glutathione S-transferase family protein n=1 Tax=Falsigemmobacter faecalis TaxID=2488730 RepID=A0A3P3DGC5_9RHOB|nr:glutathione S-transferase family protein [Falsigemmobacter faecalis]RRH72592.1 glutathione S-transferase family protein [Falsigemmobacter faecalis]
MIRLYGVARSRATRPLWVLYEADVAFEQIPVIQAYRLAEPRAAGAPLNTASPEFLAVNAQGLVPALQDGDLMMTESLAIAWYLARVYGGDLAPRTPQEEAMALQWGFVGGTAVEDAGLRITKAVTLMGYEAAMKDPAVQADVAALRRPFALIEAGLEGRDWLLGDRFTVADIMLAECVRYAQTATELLAEYPRLSDWLARAQSRPAFVKVMADRAAEPA